MPLKVIFFFRVKILAWKRRLKTKKKSKVCSWKLLKHCNIILHVSWIYMAEIQLFVQCIIYKLNSFSSSTPLLFKMQRTLVTFSFTLILKVRVLLYSCQDELIQTYWINSPWQEYEKKQSIQSIDFWKISFSKHKRIMLV